MVKYIFLFLVGGMAFSPIRALEIPLEKGAGRGSGVGYVDMELIFQEYPETQKAKKEYFAELTKRREALAQREEELATLRQQLGVLRLELGKMNEAGAPSAETSTDTAQAPAVSTVSVSAVRDTILEREKGLAEKEAGLEQARAEAAKAVKDLEERRSLQIFGKLYSALVQLAEENNVSLVVDRASILYGQAAVDLTDKLSRRVRGLPDEVDEDNSFSPAPARRE